MSRSPARAILRLLTALVAVLSLGALMAGPAASAAAPAKPAAEVIVLIEDFQFVPSSVTIRVGDTVRWTNNDSATHTSTSDNGVWNSGNLTAGTSFRHTFRTAGSFSYHCAIHPSMTGTVTVR
ncbi:cupredoxin domain-containing protein [Streptomyces albireticuli]|uniref:cupredoxin domain-containing protein n=1 Tax=Streptomyces albireticuli TaxID=1940 RepID=UPI0036BA509B